jgi:acetyltransferase-like isoleucine patch superfamily enzyme
MIKDRLVSIFKESKSILWLASKVYNTPTLFSIKGIKNNEVNFSSSFIYKSNIIIKGKNNKVNIAPENRLSNCLIFIKGNYCEINISKHCIISNTEIWIEDDYGVINIGYRTTMEGGHIAATEGKKITIGEDCMFSHRIEIRNGDSHSIYNVIDNQQINFAKDISIGNHVWMGADAKVLKGVTIDDGAIIASGAIITGKVDSNSIYGGIPARKIKDSIYWKRER